MNNELSLARMIDEPDEDGSVEVFQTVPVLTRVQGR